MILEATFLEYQMTENYTISLEAEITLSRFI